jgi:hypothetical protein
MGLEAQQKKVDALLSALKTAIEEFVPSHEWLERIIRLAKAAHLKLEALESILSETLADVFKKNDWSLAPLYRNLQNYWLVT